MTRNIISIQFFYVNENWFQKFHFDNFRELNSFLYRSIAQQRPPKIAISWKQQLEPSNLKHLICGHGLLF